MEDGIITSNEAVTLQWGHGHVAVEIMMVDGERRKAAVLQWGHGHVAVEMESCRKDTRRAIRFNGATATWPWKCRNWRRC